MRLPRRLEHPRGFALLIVLWSMVLLSLLFARLVSAGRSEAEIAFNLRAAAQRQAQADGLLYSVIFSLLGPGRHWPADGAAHRIRLPAAVASVSIENLDGLINPNTASPALLYALLSRVGADATTARSVSQAMADWRSPDAQGVFEAPQYLSAGLSYTPAGSPFQSIGELGLVLGMTPELLAKLAPHLSLYNGDNPNPDDADPVVRHALRDTGTVGTSGASHPLRVVAVDIVISGAGGTEASRQADVQLQSSSSPTGFQILTWESGGA
ncbi:general secretion pathway protein GspK [Acidisoma sp.]|uniref:general secretion pathway protein GspK n=1 Tax=Acidisoma sp. TaxID=1872115 RepID=UPI003B0040E2